MPVIHAASPRAAPALVVGEPFASRPFADEDLWAAAVDVVVVLYISEEFVGALVVNDRQLHPPVSFVSVALSAINSSCGYLALIAL